MLLEHNADVNAKDGNGFTPFFYTMSMGVQWMYPNQGLNREKDMQIMELLYSHGADINAKGNKGDTLLSTAKQTGNAELIDWFVKHGAKE